LRNPRKGKHPPEKTDPKKKNQPTSAKLLLLPLINKAPKTDYHGKKFHREKENPTKSNNNNDNSKYKTKERASQQAKQDSGGGGKRRSWGPQGALGE
jgi:hypothetical protein